MVMIVNSVIHKDLCNQCISPLKLAATFYISTSAQQFVTRITTYYVFRWPCYYYILLIKLGSSTNYKMTEQTNRPIIRANRYMSRPMKDVVSYTWLTPFSTVQIFHCLTYYSALVSFLVRCVSTQELTKGKQETATQQEDITRNHD
jgi:hypothetical protein